MKLFSFRFMFVLLYFEGEFPIRCYFPLVNYSTYNYLQYCTMILNIPLITNDIRGRNRQQIAPSRLSIAHGTLFTALLQNYLLVQLYEE